MKALLRFLPLLALTVCGQDRYQAIILEQPYLSAKSLGISCGNIVGMGSNNEVPKREYALLWNKNYASPLVPISKNFDTIQFACVNYEVVGGFAYPVGVKRPHGVIYDIATSNFVDLHPPQFDETRVAAVWGDTQVGEGLMISGEIPQHALFWPSKTTNVISLHPKGFQRSTAKSVSGKFQAGYGYLDSTIRHALLWTGHPNTVVDLHPTLSPGYAWTVANGVNMQGHAVGSGLVGDPSNSNAPENSNHALLWLGSAQECIDLHPSGFFDSYAQATSGGKQVGCGTIPDQGVRALAWSGSAASVVNLHHFLPANCVASYAQAIDEFGNIAGMTVINGAFKGVIWIPQFTPQSTPQLIMAPYLQSAGRARLQLMGIPGQTYALQRSLDFRNWSEIISVQFSQSPFYYSDGTFTDAKRSFYRMVQK